MNEYAALQVNHNRNDQVCNKKDTALAYLLDDANWWAAHVIHDPADFCFAAPTMQSRDDVGITTVVEFLILQGKSCLWV